MNPVLSCLFPSMSSTWTNLKGYSFYSLAYMFHCHFMHLSSWEQFNPIFANNKSCEQNACVGACSGARWQNTSNDEVRLCNHASSVLSYIWRAPRVSGSENLHLVRSLLSRLRDHLGWRMFLNVTPNPNKCKRGNFSSFFNNDLFRLCSRDEGGKDKIYCCQAVLFSVCMRKKASKRETGSWNSEWNKAQWWLEGGPV